MKQQKQIPIASVKWKYIKSHASYGIYKWECFLHTTLEVLIDFSLILTMVDIFLQKVSNMGNNSLLGVVTIKTTKNTCQLQWIMFF